MAESIFESEFDSESSETSVEKIEAYITANIGRLNTLLEEAYVDGDYTNEHQAMFAQMYLNKYYSNIARRSAAGYSTDVISAKEGDIEFQLANKTEVSKSYRTLAKDAEETLNLLVKSFRNNKAKPDAVLSNDTQY